MQAYKLTMTNADLMEIYKFLEVKITIDTLTTYIHINIHTYIHTYTIYISIYVNTPEIHEVDFKVSGVEPDPLVFTRVHERGR